MPPELGAVLFTVSTALALFAAGALLLTRVATGEVDALRGLALSLVLVVCTAVLMLSLQLAPVGYKRVVTPDEEVVSVVYSENPYAALYYIPLVVGIASAVVSALRLAAEVSTTTIQEV